MFKAVSAGGFHSCGLRSDDTITCWGNNGAGRTDAPAGVFKAVSAGGFHSCGLRSDDTITCWGNNGFGQVYVPTGTFKAVTAGNQHTCGLRTDGVIFCWGRLELRTVHTVATRAAGITEAPPIKAKAVSAGGLHTCGLRTDDTITCWGHNQYGQSNQPTGTFKTVTTSVSHSCGLRTDNTIVCWGDNEYGKADAPAGTFQTVTAGNQHTCGLRTDNTILCWGYNLHAQAGAPAGVLKAAPSPADTFKAVTAGGEHTCALRTDDTILCWGSNSFGQADAPAGVFKAVTAGPRPHVRVAHRRHHHLLGLLRVAGRHACRCVQSRHRRPRPHVRVAHRRHHHLLGQDYVGAHALRKRGWSISAIARHLGRDRKTVRAHLLVSGSPGSDRAGPVRGGRSLCWAAANGRSPPLGDRAVRRSQVPGLRPELYDVCSQDQSPAAASIVWDVWGNPGRAVAMIDHPAGAECQWDWLELGDIPWGSAVFVLVGVLSHSGRFRAWISSSQDQAHLVEGIDEVLRISRSCGGGGGYRFGRRRCGGCCTKPPPAHPRSWLGQQRLRAEQPAHRHLQDRHRRRPALVRTAHRQHHHLLGLEPSRADQASAAPPEPPPPVEETSKDPHGELWRWLC